MGKIGPAGGRVFVDFSAEVNLTCDFVDAVQGSGVWEFRVPVAELSTEYLQQKKYDLR